MVRQVTNLNSTVFKINKYMSKFITNKHFEPHLLSFWVSSHYLLYLILELLFVDSYVWFIFQRQHFWCMHSIFDAKVQQLLYSFLSHVYTFEQIVILIFDFAPRCHIGLWLRIKYKQVSDVKKKSVKWWCGTLTRSMTCHMD